MFNFIYHLYQTLDSVIIFSFLSYTLLILCGFKKNHTVGRSIAVGSSLYLLFTIIVYLILRLELSSICLKLTGAAQTPYWFYFVCTIPVSVLCAHIALAGTLFTKLVYVLYFMTFTQLYKMVCSPLYSQEFSMQPQVYRTLDMLTTLVLYILLFLLSKLFRKIKLSTPFPMSCFKGVLILYFPIGFLIFFGISSSTQIYSVNQIAILSGILLTNLPIIYYFFATIIHSYEDQRKLDDALTQTRTQLARYRYSLEVQEQVKKERHELKNNYFYIQTLLADKKYDQLDTYISQAIGGKMSKLTDIQTGNTLIDYLLNRKIQEAQKLHVKTYTEIIIPGQLSINEEVLCTILLNLLDNAIEASKQEDTPDIQIVIKCVQNYLLCKISNKVSSNIFSENPSLATSKADASNHGLGIKIIRSAVESQNGLLNFECEKGYFTASVMLPFNQPV